MNEFKCPHFVFSEQIMENIDHKHYGVGDSTHILHSIAPGSSFDWARGSLGIKYPYTVELRGYYGFILKAENILKVAKEAKSAVLVFARYAANVTNRL